MYKKKILEIKNAEPRLSQFRFTVPVNWVLREGEQWAIIGPNGAGKNLFADLICRKNILKEGEVTIDPEIDYRGSIKSISFKDIYSLADCRNTFYQQRWHSTETEEVPFISDLLTEFDDQVAVEQMLSFFCINDLLSKRLIYLSSGELRKFLIVRTLLANPRILILDNPFIGLDVASREILHELLKQITKMEKVQVILLLSNPDDIPDMVTHVLPVKDKILLSVYGRDNFLANRTLINELFPDEKISSPALPTEKEKRSAGHVVTLRMEKVSIKYGTRTILDNLNWEVRNGEKWALSGPNGSGKSTLLSLVYADNPQSYANTFYLFDRKRGTGESIWDIKKRIGYVSPEMHLYYNKNVPAIQIVGSGFFDSIGLYRKYSIEQESIAQDWLAVFGIDHLADRLFLTLSSGEQRLVLLARAFVKDPDLLILDEPLHGLDVYRKRLVAQIIEQFCTRSGKTLIYVTHYPNELPAVVDLKLELTKH